MELQTQRGRALGLLPLAGAVAGAGLLGRREAKPGLWYRRLKKPAFTPSKRVFGPVWAILYPLIALSGWMVWRAPRRRARRRALALWGAHLALNAAWVPLFFGKHRPDWAMADVALMLATGSAYAKTAAKVSPGAAWMFAPYLGWVAFAGLLNEEIVRRNR